MIAALWEKVQPYPSPFMSVIHASAQPGNALVLA
jgi:hypothetical protein